MISPLRPRIAVSACLLGDAVRYDGTNKAHHVVTEVLAPHVEWVPVCPEVEAGFGVPRPAIEVVSEDPVRVARVADGEDVTEKLRGAASNLASRLNELGADGQIVKARSPSCGLSDAPRALSGGTGPGLYVGVLLEALPDLPIVDEAGLDDPARLRRFLEAVVSRARQRMSCDVSALDWLAQVLGAE